MLGEAGWCSWEDKTDELDATPLVGRLDDEGRCGEDRGGRGDCRGGEGNLGREKTSCGASLAKKDDSTVDIFESARDSVVDSFDSARESECSLERMAGSTGG